MNKIIACMVVLMLAVFALTTVAAAQKVYLLPQQSTSAYSSTAEVEIWVDAINFQGGQINLTYDPACADVTDWTRNTTNFPMGGREHYTGNDWITFTALDSLAGEYRVGTLTVQCVHEKGCETVLAFAEPSELFDAKGNPVAVDWQAGTFKCSGSTSAATTQTSSGGGSGATNTETETPTATPASTVTQGMAAVPAASTITPTPAATPSPTVSAFVLPTPTQSPEEKKELPGFEAVFTILGVLVIQYMKSRRRE
ncbi:hypothetical protein C5S31_06625 [ANME-1 cluster archaeon GoMg2]|nr:hypothetical protein [ANME-1 cluster archaeon GoMg2]